MSKQRIDDRVRDVLIWANQTAMWHGVPVTPREREALNILLEVQRTKTKKPPSKKELAQKMGISVKRTAEILQGLSQRGLAYLFKEDGQYRRYVVTPRPTKKDISPIEEIMEDPGRFIRDAGEEKRPKIRRYDRVFQYEEVNSDEEEI